jgi:hypothetical protein
MVESDFKDLSSLLALLKNTGLKTAACARIRTLQRPLEDSNVQDTRYYASQEYARRTQRARRREQNTAARRQQQDAEEFDMSNPELQEIVQILTNCVAGLSTDILRPVQRRCRDAMSIFENSRDSDAFQQTYFAKLTFMLLYKSLYIVIQPYCQDENTCAYTGAIGDCFLGIFTALRRLLELLFLSAEDLQYLRENSTAYDPAVLGWHARHFPRP